jgi:hypothetical protein
MAKLTADYNLGVLYPELVEIYDNEKNLKSIFQYAPKSNIRVWWKCNKGHSWEAQISSITRGRRCPFCSGNKVSDVNRLSNNFPILFNEIDAEIHQLDKLNDISYGSSKELWWRCKKNHSFKARVKDRSIKNSGCPECYKNKDKHKIPSPSFSLKYNYPSLIKEWDYEKNKKRPDEYFKSSSKNVWWKCDFGHSWKSKIANRTLNKTGCPLCFSQTSKMELGIYAELTSLFDGVFWRYKIGKLESDILLKNEKLCIEVDGGYWHKDKLKEDLKKNDYFENLGYDTLRVRDESLPVISEDDIVFIKGKYVIKDLTNCVIKYIYKSKNKIPNKVRVYLNSDKTIGDEYYDEISTRLPKAPIEKSLGFLFPELIKVFDIEKNYPLKPNDFYAFSKKKIWWTCNNSHSYDMVIGNKTNQKQGCPLCSGKRPSVEKSIVKLFPELLEEWDYELNKIGPENFTYGSKKKVNWICKNNHRWEMSINSRTHPRQKQGCPFCSRIRKSSI